jgi:hypothetical protein
MTWAWWRGIAALVLAASLACPGMVRGSTEYKVHIGLPQSIVDSLRLVFDLTSSNDVKNMASIMNLEHDGHARAAEGYGGPLTGQVLNELAPADTLLLGDSYFFNEAAVPFDDLNTTIRFRVELSENSGPSDAAADALSFFLTDSENGEPIASADGLGADALFAITVTGVSGGDLEVFSPMTFIPPDSLVLGIDLTAVDPGQIAQGRMRIVELAPNPSSGPVRLTYELPRPGGVVVCRIYDVSGRLVKNLHRAFEQPGRREILWDGRGGSGRRVSPGIYLMRIECAGQTVVRRFAMDG